MFEVTKSVFYVEKRNHSSGKIDDERNGVVKDIDPLDVSDENMETLISTVADHYNISTIDLILGKVVVKVIDSSIVVKRYENESGEALSPSDLADWECGKIDAFLGCYKHDVQKIERANVEFETMFSAFE